jgi:hypothetical protein
VANVGAGEGSAGDRPTELSRAIHELGNVIHSLSLRLLIMEHGALDPATGEHLRTAQRLNARGASLLSQIRELEAAAAPDPRPLRLTRHRTPR